MSEEEVKQTIQYYINESKNTKHFEFELLTNIVDYFNLKREYKQNRAIFNWLALSYKLTLKMHLEDIDYGESKLARLAAAEEILQACEFYDKEANLIKESLDEYKAYLRTETKNYLDVLLFLEREESEMYDHRHGISEIRNLY